MHARRHGPADAADRDISEDTDQKTLHHKGSEKAALDPRKPEHTDVDSDREEKGGEPQVRDSGNVRDIERKVPVDPLLLLELGQLEEQSQNRAGAQLLHRVHPLLFRGIDRQQQAQGRSRPNQQLYASEQKKWELEEQ